MSGTFTFPEDLTVSGGFSELYYRPVEYRADPSRESLSLPVDGAEVINMDQVLLISGLETAPENLLENGFTVVSPYK
ncbi:MAG: hypothetical protein GF388_02710, partial [Candidatus Aegiribacteria sp.]|nr:hypothetical protein [Candidatus Aegiribacteria sp.]MBD3294207.1 hypothetical protein [Candidatus Fermentibacteria bacterium]